MSADTPAGTRVRLCAVADVTPGEAKRIDIGDHRLAVIRIEDDFYVIGDECSHADYSLAEGELDPADQTIECWKHGSTFSVKTGEPSCLPAVKPVPVYEVSVVDGEILVVL